VTNMSMGVKIDPNLCGICGGQWSLCSHSRGDDSKAINLETESVKTPAHKLPKPTYKAEWEPGKRNKAFWEEVLVGRTIICIGWDEKGITRLTLDNGEVVYTPRNGTPIHICVEQPYGCAQEIMAEEDKKVLGELRECAGEVEP